MSEMTVTMSLNRYEHMKKEAIERDVSNFISKVYINAMKNDFKVVINQDAVVALFGKEIDILSPVSLKLQLENICMREALKDISETPITRGISPVEQSLQRVVNKAKMTLLKEEGK